MLTLTLTVDARPSSNELEIFNIVQSTLERKDEVMQRLQEYKGCQDLARKAMSAPTPENELAAFEGLLEAVESIQVFFNYAKELGTRKTKEKRPVMEQIKHTTERKKDTQSDKNDS